MLDRVVVGVDFSGPSIAAAQWVARGLAQQAELRLVHVLDVPRPPRFLEGRYPSRERLIELVREGAEAHLSPLVEALADGREAPVSEEVREGSAHAEVYAAAEAFGADLIVVGEHGRRPGVWGTLGSTAERLLRCSSIPVLLARAHRRGAPRRILLPLDDSDPALRALQLGVALGHRLGAEVTIFHAVPQSLIGHVELVSNEEATQRIEREAKEAAREWFERNVEAAGFEGKIRVDVSLGEPRFEILAAVRRHLADLVILGSHGTGRMERAIGGSVTASILRNAPCPVLVVPDTKVSAGVESPGADRVFEAWPVEAFR